MTWWRSVLTSISKSIQYSWATKLSLAHHRPRNLRLPDPSRAPLGIQHNAHTRTLRRNPASLACSLSRG